MHLTIELGEEKSGPGGRDSSAHPKQKSWPWANKNLRRRGGGGYTNEDALVDERLCFLLLAKRPGFSSRPNP